MCEMNANDVDRDCQKVRITAVDASSRADALDVPICKIERTETCARAPLPVVSKVSLSQQSSLTDRRDEISPSSSPLDSARAWLERHARKMFRDEKKTQYQSLMTATEQVRDDGERDGDGDDEKVSRSTSRSTPR